MFRCLPYALEALHRDPDYLYDIAAQVFSEYGGELDNPMHRRFIITIIRPVAQERITIMRGFSDMEKTGSVFNGSETSCRHYGASAREKVRQFFTPRSENFSTIEFTDKSGRTIRTTPYHLRQGAVHGVLDKALKKGTGMALAFGALAALLSSSNKDLPSRLGVTALMGIPAAHLLFSDDNRTQISHTGDEVAVRTLNDAVYKQEKQAAAGRPVSLAPLAGMSIPAALALDYAYNRWKYGDDPEPHLTFLGNAANKAGQLVKDNPAIAAVAGATLGAYVKNKYR